MFWTRAIYHVARAYWIKPQASYKVAQVETPLRRSTPKPCIFCLLPSYGRASFRAEFTGAKNHPLVFSFSGVCRGGPLWSLSAKNPACPAHNLWHTPAYEPLGLHHHPNPRTRHRLPSGQILRPSLDPSPRRRPAPDSSGIAAVALARYQLGSSLLCLRKPASRSPTASIPKSAIPPTFSPP